MTPEQVEAERGGARRLYLLCLWSPLIIPVSACAGPAALLVPLIVIGLVIAGFFSKHDFVRWHASQWTLLTLPAALLFFWSINSIFNSYYYGSFWGNPWFFIIVLGGWYVGNIVGFRQANRGQCWLWDRLALAAELPRPWAVSPTAPAESSMSADSYTALEQGRKLLEANKRAEAVASFMAAFRDGSPDLRRLAVAELEKLGEVETF